MSLYCDTPAARTYISDLEVSDWNYAKGRVGLIGRERITPFFSSESFTFTNNQKEKSLSEHES